MRYAVAFSAALHVLAAASSAPRWLAPDRAAPPAEEPPLVLNLQPAEPEPDPVRQVVHSAAPPDRPVQDTNLISDRDSTAQDPEDVEGKVRAPLDRQGSDGYDLGGQPPVPALKAAEVPPVAPPREEPKPEKAKSPEKTPEPPKKPAEKPKPKPKPAVEERTAVAKVEAPALPELIPPEEPAARIPEPSPETREDAAPAEPEALARIEPPDPPSPAPPRPGSFRGSVEGGIKGKGFLGFEALRDEIAPYLLEVRDRVERHWRAAMALKYSGTTAARCEIECAIDPDGKLVYVKVVKPGSSVSFAPICRESIEKAAPFPPFPFKVPDIYRNKNLEIHWTFNFM